ncbi:acetyltransferase [Pseudoalteromonas sp. C2R02]|uniref:acetyltransferase n=1 Tax=Pseudoalteromonas sp. C2R02 TaxID=2841565 RepID=UPI00339D44ED
MTKLAILGASCHGKVVADAAFESGAWDEIVFFDDAYPDKKKLECWTVIGSTLDLIIDLNNYHVIVAIGDNKTRFKKQAVLEANGAVIATVIHPKSTVSSFSTIEQGSVVMAGAIVNAFSYISKSCIVNSNSVIEHDCFLGCGVHISPNASLAGGVKIGNMSWVGIASCVRELISIGESIIIGAGSVVVKNVFIKGVYVGNPLRQIE